MQRTEEGKSKASTLVLLDGTATARAIRAELTEQVSALKARGITPHLAAVLDRGRSRVGNVCGDEAEGVQVGGHGLLRPSPGRRRHAGRSGSAGGTPERRPAVSGILVQHPLPKHLHEPAVLDRVSPDKDIDGISRMSLGGLINGEPAFPSCTPAGIIELLDRYNIPIEGKTAVVVGRSIILGKPVAMMLLNRNATVTICHSRTPNLGDVTRQADILVAAVGRAELIKGDMIKPGAAVMDAGYNRVEGRSRRRGRRGVRVGVARRGVHHARSRRRRPHDHRHAAAQHRSGRRQQ